MNVLTCHGAQNRTPDVAQEAKRLGKKTGDVQVYTVLETGALAIHCILFGLFARLLDASTRGSRKWD